MAKEKTISKEVESLVSAFKANEGKAMTLKEVADLAGVEAKSGYLAGVKNILGKDNLIIDKTEVETVVTKKVNTYAYKPDLKD